MKILRGAWKSFSWNTLSRNVEQVIIRYVHNRDTFVLFITYMQDKEQVKAENLSFGHINRKTLVSFLNWLQDERRSSASTRNQRYAAIRSFFRFMIYEDPKHMSQWKDICTIRLKKDSKKSILIFRLMR